MHSEAVASFNWWHGFCSAPWRSCCCDHAGLAAGSCWGLNREQFRETPDDICVPDRIRTCDLWYRKPMLSSTELRRRSLPRCVRGNAGYSSTRGGLARNHAPRCSGGCGYVACLCQGLRLVCGVGGRGEAAGGWGSSRLPPPMQHALRFQLIVMEWVNNTQL